MLCLSHVILQARNDNKKNKTNKKANNNKRNQLKEKVAGLFYLFFRLRLRGRESISTGTM